MLLDFVFYVIDIIEGLQDGVQFIVDDFVVFLCMFVFDFNEVVEFFGMFGFFYVGYGLVDEDGMQEWFGLCSDVVVGFIWEELVFVFMLNGSICGFFFCDFFNVYCEDFVMFGGLNCVDDLVGCYLLVFGVIGVLIGEVVIFWQEVCDVWIVVQLIFFEFNFDDVGVGYWGQICELCNMQ